MQRASRQRIVVAIFLCLQQVFLFNSPLIGMTSARATERGPLPRAWLPFARPSLPPARPSAIAPLIAPRPSQPTRVPTSAFAPAPAPPPAPGPSDCSAPANAIVAENCLPGNTGWDVTGAGDSDILGFTTDISVNRGDSIAFKINTPSTDYRIDIYRMGYYGGTGARKVATITPSLVLPQVQAACLTVAATGLIDCGNWSESASWLVPPTATSGIYFARPVLRMLVQQPLNISNRRDQIDVECTVVGGGLSGQAGAVRHGLSRAMTNFEPELRALLKKGGFLTRDSRTVERKKYGRAKARRSFQFSKR